MVGWVGHIGFVIDLCVCDDCSISRLWVLVVLWVGCESGQVSLDLVFWIGWWVVLGLLVVVSGCCGIVFCVEWLVDTGCGW